MAKQGQRLTTTPISDASGVSAPDVKAEIALHIARWDIPVLCAEHVPKIMPMHRGHIPFAVKSAQQTHVGVRGGS